MTRFWIQVATAVLIETSIRPTASTHSRSRSLRGSTESSATWTIIGISIAMTAPAVATTITWISEDFKPWVRSKIRDSVYFLARTIVSNAPPGETSRTVPLKCSPNSAMS